MPKQKDKPYLEDINSRIEVNEESQTTSRLFSSFWNEDEDGDEKGQVGSSKNRNSLRGTVMASQGTI